MTVIYLETTSRSVPSKRIVIQQMQFKFIMHYTGIKLLKYVSYFI